jgi:hypothetical protein
MATAPVKIVPPTSPPIEFGELSLRLRPRLRMPGITACDIYTTKTPDIP